MTACIIREFCCGCNLRHGAITAAVVQTITVIVLILSGAYLIYEADTLPQKLEEYAGGSSSMLEETKSNSKTLYGLAIFSVKIRGILHLLEGLGGIVVLGCLIHGIVKEIPGLLVPWLVVAMIQIIVYTLNSLTYVINHEFFIFLNLPIAIFYIYLWVVVLNYFHELRRKRKAGPSFVQQEWETLPPAPPPYSVEIMKA